MEAVRNRRNTGGEILLTKREIIEMITIPTLAKSVRFIIWSHVVLLYYARPADVSDTGKSLST
jgi:hypothetical protein